MSAPYTSADALKGFDDLPDSAFVRTPTVQALFSVSAVTVWRWTRGGRLPAPVQLSPGCTAWRVGDIRAAMKAMQTAAA
ncbi:MAG: AlpA family phage regulatory protein [Phenylobacterium sp.]|nr:AlpA family phage regulatory protein [Phenylobacterium sp.]